MVRPVLSRICFSRSRRGGLRRRNAAAEIDAADAFLATLAPKGLASPVAPRPLAAEFLKLRPATEAERALFTDAYAKLGADHDRWAYTETSHSVEDRRVLVTRVDPSKTGTQRCVLLKGGGAARIVPIKIARDFESTRTDYERVEPRSDPGTTE